MESKQLVFTGLEKFEIRNIKLPELKDNQVLVKVFACGLCTWERDIFFGKEVATFPFAGGHEIAGEVVQVGKETPSNIKIGQKVAVAKWKRCNQCELCRKGFDNQCEEAILPVPEGVIWGPGGFSEYLIAEPYEIFPVGDDIENLAYAAMAEPIACVSRGISRSRIRVGDTAVVVGAGLMGLLFLKLLKWQGVNTIVVQRSAYRRELAGKMGANAVVDSIKENWVQQVKDLTNGKGAQAVFYTAGGAEVLNECLSAATIGGRILDYAPVHSEKPALNPDIIHYNELEFIGSIRHDKESFQLAAKIIGSKAIDLSDLNLEFGRFECFKDELVKANENKEIHRILLQW